jgi:hypothetical protein
MDVEKFYEALRNQIIHEDNLCNHRMTWLIGLQAFLFGAYGFSLSAEGAAGAVPGAAVLNVISSARIGFAVAGMLSPIPVLFALWAAVRSIAALVDRWHEKFTTDDHESCPQIIGNHSPEKQRGTLLGQTPLFAIPVLLTGVWIYIGWHTDHFVQVASYIALITLAVSVIFSAGFFFARHVWPTAAHGKGPLNKRVS